MIQSFMYKLDSGHILIAYTVQKKNKIIFKSTDVGQKLIVASKKEDFIHLLEEYSKSDKNKKTLYDYCLSIVYLEKLMGGRDRLLDFVYRFEKESDHVKNNLCLSADTIYGYSIQCPYISTYFREIVEYYFLFENYTSAKLLTTTNTDNTISISDNASKNGEYYCGIDINNEVLEDVFGEKPDKYNINIAFKIAGEIMSKYYSHIGKHQKLKLIAEDCESGQYECLDAANNKVMLSLDDMKCGLLDHNYDIDFGDVDIKNRWLNLYKMTIGRDCAYLDLSNIPSDENSNIYVTVNSDIGKLINKFKSIGADVVKMKSHVSCDYYLCKSGNNIYILSDVPFVICGVTWYSNSKGYFSPLCDLVCKKLVLTGVLGTHVICRDTLTDWFNVDSIEVLDTGDLYLGNLGDASTSKFNQSPMKIIDRGLGLKFF